MRRSAGPSGPPTLPAAVVSELLEAGLSRSTVLAMEHWKAREVLDLLRSAHARERERWMPAPTGGLPTPLFTPGAETGGMVRFSTQD
ncbi:MAG TPA: hypothetical protein VEK76_07650 [Candidatus Binatia bacterium]|nr:hypothetical protein [Candidatus Binatia bacterium]